MLQKNHVLAALVVALCSAHGLAASVGSPLEVRIQDSGLTAEQGWTVVAPGVYQRIDPATGAISRVSSGEGGRRYEYALTQAELARVQREQTDALQRGEPAQKWHRRTAELQAELASLERPAGSLAKGTVNYWDGTPGCANAAGDFQASFSKAPRVGGGVVGTVSATTMIRSCMGFECIPGNYAGDEYTGYAKSGARASNSGGALTQNAASPVMVVYNTPQAFAQRSTPNVADASCTLRATGQVNTTYVTTPYESCYLFRQFSHELSCAAIP